LVRTSLAGVRAIGLPRLIGPVLRDASLRTSRQAAADPLPRARIRERYGADDSWPLFWHELSAGWTLAAEVARLMGGPVPPTVQLVAGAGPFRQRRLDRQRALSDRLGSRLVVVPDASHLIHLDRPDAIAAAMTTPITSAD
jgi:pimeloyl-ACP methyl ester carboxylesterase